MNPFLLLVAGAGLAIGPAVSSCQPQPREVGTISVSATRHDGEPGTCVPNVDDSALVPGDPRQGVFFLRVSPPAAFGDVEDVRWHISNSQTPYPPESCTFGTGAVRLDGAPHVITATVEAWSGDVEITRIEVGG